MKMTIMSIRRRIRFYCQKAAYLYQFFRECYLDSRRYLRASKSCVSGQDSAIEHLESDIIRRYHIVEKGLCMPDFRPRFGVQIVTELVQMLATWKESQGQTVCEQINCAEESLRAYYRKHRELDVDVSDLIPPQYTKDEAPIEGSYKAVKPYRELDIAEKRNLVEAVRARSSLRDFDRDRVPEKTVLQEAVKTALTAPSVCNRQTCRVHVASGKLAHEVLQLQNGNRGFGQTVPVVLVVTSDMRYFIDIIERYQAWIDGGIFSMNLLLGLHGEGLGAVPLNWSVVNERDQQLRDLLSIPAHERIILMIGCGYPSDEAMVTHSPRRDPAEVVIWH